LDDDIIGVLDDNLTIRILKECKSMNSIINKRLPGIIMCIVLPLSVVACSSQSSLQSSQSLSIEEPPSISAVSRMELDGFDTPEEAVKAYLEGLKAADPDQMIGTFAVERYVENYDFEANLDRLKVYVPTQDIKFPNANAFVSKLNVESRRIAVTNAIIRQYLAICYPEFDQSFPVMLNDGAGDFSALLVEKLNTVDLDSMTLLGFIPPESLAETYTVKMNQENMARQAKVYGAEKIVSLVAVFELQGNKYMLCSDVISYNGKWFMLQFGGNIGALLSISPYYAGIIPLSVPGIAEEFSGALESLTAP